MLASAVSATLRGIDGQEVVVEVHISRGLPSFHVVGLPDTSCREARDRVRAAIISSDFAWPSSRITVNLAPSGVPKEGAGLDLAIALGILAAAPNEDLQPEDLAGHAFIGELGLNGSVRAVSGTLALVGPIKAATVVVAPSAAHEAALAGAESVRACRTIGEVVGGLSGVAEWPDEPEPVSTDPKGHVPDLVDVAGHPFARHALEIAAAGGHNLLLVGPPGTGKSMLARRLPGLLPDLDEETAVLASRVHSVAGLALPAGRLLSVPPFRAPHHSATMAALIGGGSGRFRPGEISCAHGGVLFLDELGEFSPRVLDALRQPLEDGSIRISRAHGSVVFPARFCLVAAMNPCPCGQAGSAELCRCSDAARQRYVRRLSGPLLDRIDLRVHMSRPTPSELLGPSQGEATDSVRDRVLSARAMARARGSGVNSMLPVERLDELAPIDDAGRALLAAALADQRLSARGLVRVRAVARTVADLAGAEIVDEAAVATALAFRAQPAILDGAGHRHG